MLHEVSFCATLLDGCPECISVKNQNLILREWGQALETDRSTRLCWVRCTQKKYQAGMGVLPGRQEPNGPKLKWRTKYTLGYSKRKEYTGSVILKNRTYCLGILTGQNIRSPDALNMRRLVPLCSSITDGWRKPLMWLLVYISGHEMQGRTVRIQRCYYIKAQTLKTHQQSRQKWLV